MSESFVVIDDKYLLPLADALELLRIMAKATRVKRTYGEMAPYAYEVGALGKAEILSPAQFAAMKLGE